MHAKVNYYCRIIFFCLMGWLFLSWPIGGIFSDSDIWYHLSGGEYFFEHHRIPSDSYFSFISPVREWTNYYWLFQVIVHPIHKIGGYYGLIIFKTILFLLTLFFILQTLSDRQTLGQRHNIYITLAFALYAVAILPRELFLVRPHLFSYLFLAVLVYILEQRREKIWLIPFVCVAAANIHGMEYPIFLLILGAYLAETLFFKFHKNDTWILTKRQRIILILSIYCLFITPHGIALIELPFDMSPFVNQAIREMAARPFTATFQLSLTSLLRGFSSAQNVIILFALTAAMVLTAKRAMRISHLLMIVGAVVLLNRNARFIYEAIFLMLPTVSRALRRLPSAKTEGKQNLVLAVNLTLLVLLPCVLIYSTSIIKPHYPISYQRFPFGIATFLDQIKVGGTILNEHNSGGFLQKELNPEYKIYMDLQLSIFDTLNLFNSALSRKDGEVLDRLLKRYNPDFISIDRGNSAFANLVAGRQVSRFVPVFFDDSEVLYVNEGLKPEIAATYGLHHVNPFEAENFDYDKVDDETLRHMLQELERMSTFYEKSARINTMITNIMLNLEQTDGAAHYADAVVQYHPDNFIGYALKGQVFFANRNYNASIGWFKKALKKPSGRSDASIYRNLHKAYSQTGQYHKAYRTLAESINVFSEKTSYKDLYNLGIYAAATGKKKHAITLLKMAAARVPESDTEYMQKIGRAKFWKDEQ